MIRGDRDAAEPPLRVDAKVPLGAAAEAPLRVDVVRGTPTEEELAALIAVVTEEYSRQEATATASDAPTRSAWELTARNLREPLRREFGWGHYAG